MSLLLASVPSNLVNLAGGSSWRSSFTAPLTASVNFLTTGKITGMTSFTSDNWYSLAPQTDVGDNYEIQATLLYKEPGATFNGTLDTWLALTDPRTWSLTQSGAGGGEITAAILVKIRALGGSVVAEGTYDFKVEVFL